MPNPISILLLTENADAERRWAESLSALQPRLLRAADIAPDTLFDVVVTDLSGPFDILSQRAEVFARGEFAIVAIGDAYVGPPAPDVRLPAEHHPRELLMACQLLEEIVRLRRGQHQGDHLHQTLAKLAISDPLTGIANRRAWENELPARVDESDRKSRPLCLAIIDLDGFKRVNDQYGHVAGDDVLKLAAQTLSVNVRSRDFVARYGGDEFAVLLSDAQPEAVAAILERMRSAVGTAIATLPYGPVTASVGVAIYGEQETRNAAALFEAADRALRSAKATGRDRVVVAEKGNAE